MLNKTINERNEWNMFSLDSDTSLANDLLTKTGRSTCRSFILLKLNTFKFEVVWAFFQKIHGARQKASRPGHK